VTPESPDLYAFSRNPGHLMTAIFIAGKKIPPWFQQFTSEKGCPLGFRWLAAKRFPLLLHIPLRSIAAPTKTVSMLTNSPSTAGSLWSGQQQPGTWN